MVARRSAAHGPCGQQAVPAGRHPIHL